MSNPMRALLGNLLEDPAGDHDVAVAIPDGGLLDAHLF